MESSEPRDQLRDLEVQFSSLLRRAYELGCLEGKRATIASFARFAGLSTEAIAATQAADSEPKLVRARAPRGRVQELVRQVIEAHPQGIRQGDIIAAGASRGFEIKPSSMRMALPVLEETGRVEQRDGKWFPKGDEAPDGASRSTN